MEREPYSSESFDLMLVVERLSTQDQRRIVRLIDLLRIAPDWLRERTQRTLKRLIAHEPQTQAECLASIDGIIALAERELQVRLRIAAPPERAETSALRLGYGRQSG
jgi:hypothetical protein